MDQEGEIAKSEDACTSAIEDQHPLKSSCNGEGKLTLCINSNDQERSEKETPDIYNDKVNNGNISEEITDQHVSGSSDSDTESDDASTIRNESTNENAESFSILINDDKQEDIDENLGKQTSHNEDQGNIEQKDISPILTEQYDDPPNLSTENGEGSTGTSDNTHTEFEHIENEIEEVTPKASLLSGGSKDEMIKPITDENILLTKEEIEVKWSEGMQEELGCELIEDEQGAEIKNLECSSNVEKELFGKETCDPHECGDNLIANKAEEGYANRTPGVEVIGPKTNDEMKNNLSERDKSTEDIKDPQRPRSRTYPFKVLASGLPLGARREDVMYYFSQFGEVLKLWDEGRHRANVLFADEESFKKAVFAPDPYFDDHKLMIRSLNEITTIISGIPRSISAKDAEKALKSALEEAGVAPCRIVVPSSDPSETTEDNLNQGHALVAFCDPLTLQKAEDIQSNNPFMITGCPLKLYSSCNDFYDKFCIRIFPLPADKQRAVLYHNLHAAFKSFGEIVAIICQFVANTSSYTGYVLFESEDSVQQAKEKGEVKILEEFVQIQGFNPFDQGQGFRHLWLKVLNLPPRATITEIKHHFGHDRGILNIELDLDFGSCFMHVNSESAIQRCLQMHQTYLRGKCLAVLIAEDHPDRVYYREMSRRGRRPNFRNSTGRKKAASNNSNSGFNGKTFTSATQPQGNQDRRGFERGDRKFSKSRSNASHPKESPKPVKEDGDGVKIADSPAV
ncbi:hypothetical protein R5R35_000361 [Gryllus longicercus]|uniref:RRM domain-containing protein n=1 Tax=Gryllus longicercus TaxID=2509291 RepID=A0AAN9W399_9ORTH